MLNSPYFIKYPPHHYIVLSWLQTRIPSQAPRRDSAASTGLNRNSGALQICNLQKQCIPSNQTPWFTFHSLFHVCTCAHGHVHTQTPFPQESFEINDTSLQSIQQGTPENKNIFLRMLGKSLSHLREYHLTPTQTWMSSAITKLLLTAVFFHQGYNQGSHTAFSLSDLFKILNTLLFLLCFVVHGLTFVKIVLLWCSSHTPQFSDLCCRIQWF